MCRRSQPKKKTAASRSPAKQPRPDMKEYKSAQFVKDSDDSSEEEEEEKPRKKIQPAAAASGEREREREREVAMRYLILLVLSLYFQVAVGEVEEMRIL